MRPHSSPRLVHALLPLLLLLPYAAPQVTVTLYNPTAQARLAGSTLSTTEVATSTSVAPGTVYTGAAVADPIVLTPPAIPAGFQTQFGLDLEGSTPAGASIGQDGNFLGFSIEFSVSDQVIGFNSTVLQVPFLNLMEALAERGGSVRIRVGGNTQDYATLVEGPLPDHHILLKDKGDNTNPTETPTTKFTADLIYMLGNVSALVDIDWWLGIPLSNLSDIRLGIADVSEPVLGSSLLGFQVGNEPDLYEAHGHRAEGYGPADYVGEFGQIISALANDTSVTTRNNLIGPSVSGTWTPEDVFNAGFVTEWGTSINALAVEHYPTDNCAALYPEDNFTPVDPQTVFPTFLSHISGQTIVQPFLNSTAYAQSVQKPFLMFETNTASCGGFPGLSDSFGSALWTADYFLQMAYSNFSGANLHVSGQDVYYNPFSPPPTNLSTTHGWTVWPNFYATLAVAEAFGAKGGVRVVDMFANGKNNQTPGYVLYEGGEPARVALFNYVTDATGASDLKVTLNVPAAPSSVQVKYLQSSSVSNKFNVTWAGQTYGNAVFASDGRLNGTLDVQTVTCTAGACIITVPAPSMALVFLTAQSFDESSPGEEKTYATTATTNGGAATMSVDAQVLATSNGHTGGGRVLGSTSKGSEKESGARRRVGVAAGVGAGPGVLTIGLGLGLGALVVGALL